MPDHIVDPTDPLPKYYQVYVSLGARIHAGEFAPGDALPAERQLSADYGVSRITVIKAKDLLAADKLIMHQQGRGSFVLDRSEPGCGTEACRVAFCLPTFADSYVAEILVGAARVAMQEDVQLEIVGVEVGDREATRIRKAIDGGVDGVLLLPRARYPDWALYEELSRDAFPLVLLDRYYPALDVDRVVFDDDEVGHALAKSLIEMGHRKIGIITGDEADASSVRGRIQGYRRALEEAGLL
ncbi:MAG: GntR family transcriptional regulator, partial [Anaerolineae bacterium]|nr:GntR family transcriptional regulator [Anaerolineae bacterium]